MKTFCEADILYFTELVQKHELQQKLVALLKKRLVNELPWLDIQFKDFNLLYPWRKKQFKVEMRKFHIGFINRLVMAVPTSFQYSKPDDEFTYREMATELIQYCYSRGMNREQVVEMLSNNRKVTDYVGRKAR